MMLWLCAAITAVLAAWLALRKLRHLTAALAPQPDVSEWDGFEFKGGPDMNRTTLTQHLRFLEELAIGGPAAPERFEFADGRYTIRVANDLESRRKAYQLVYRLYLEREYAKPHPSRMWLSIFDALPETVTLLVERQAEGCGLKAEGTTAASAVPSALGPQPSVFSAPVGALTVVFDSPMGLPADKVYRSELDALRGAGRRIAEVVSLGIAEEAQAGSVVLVKLFNFAYFIARGIRGATDFVVTVNPRHVRFYERLMLFAEAGAERGYDKVGGAPAVLLRLEFDVAEGQRQLAASFRHSAIDRGSESPKPFDNAQGHEPVEWPRACPPGRAESRHSIYGQFHAVAEEPETVAALERELRPMTEQELGCLFVAGTDLLAEATQEQRDFIRGQQQHCARRLDRVSC